MDLTGAAALVTGGAGAIGAAVAQRLIAAGADVTLADLDAHRGEQVARRLGAVFVPTDVARPESLSAAVAAAEARSPLRFVHLNAGVGTPVASVEEVDEELYRRLLGTNLDGVFWGVRACLPALRRAGGGSVVVTSSLAGLAPMPEDPLYSMAKSGVISLTRALGPVLRTDRIRLNCVCPGFVDTPLVPQVVRDSGFPLLTADEVADAVITVGRTETDSGVYVLQPGHELIPYVFRGVPGARTTTPDGRLATAPITWRQ